MILPGRVASHRISSLQLVPSWETKKRIHELYTASCPSDYKPIGYHSFIRTWKTALPNIAIQLPRSDLCLACQQDIVSISKLANMDKHHRTQRIQKSPDHLNSVKQERQVYLDTIHKCKLVVSGHPMKQLGSMPRGLCSGCAHISFDFAQQVHVPNLPDQPGPLYFLRLSQYNLGLAFHTAYSCIFHPCDLLLLFPLLHFSPWQFCPYRIFHSRIFSRPVFSALLLPC